MPSGPASSFTGVVFTANGKPLEWRRDDVNLFEFHLTVPSGVTTLHAHVDSIVTRRVSQRMAALEWEALMLYPAHVPVKDIPIQPSVKVPTGWGYWNSAEAGERRILSRPWGGKCDEVRGNER